MPDEQVRLMSETNPQLKMVATLLGYDMSATGKKAERLLGWTPRSPEDAIIASAESLIRPGLIRH
jgi:dihydroflavonol-4-reductase